MNGKDRREEASAIPVKGRMRTEQGKDPTVDEETENSDGRAGG